MILILLFACGHPISGEESGLGSDDSGVELIDDLGYEGLTPPIIGGDSDEFYADGAVGSVELELHQEALAALRDAPRDWVPGVFVWEGVRYGPVGVRVKGESSYRGIDEKPSLKVKFSEYLDDGEFMGMTRLVFNNDIGDPTSLRGRLGYYVFRESGVPAPRCNHVTLQLNGADYGLYSNVENTDKHMLARWFPNPDGDMWEIHDADFREGLLDGFEVEQGSGDPAPIEALTATMAGSDATTRAFEHVDETEWYRYWTTMAITAQLDGYPFSDPGDDAHLYLDPETGKLRFLPHGLDEVYRDDASVEYVQHGILATACLDDRSCRDTWREAVIGQLEVVDGLELIAFMEAVNDEIASARSEDPRREFDEAETEAELSFLEEFLEERREDLEEQMDWDD